eukprot:CAMPEP_0185766742 /NCGR_PEP_ID=MMETSP1174-20130828/38624_1 /TAXON_ID=35687 /ORGANISM="Dictyocha speculum, Strain CCMP1381" /LENGTH=72 /DNA_ID=CAMNT_0028450553 /DNA_START=126 /DNA_END=344 /DNA_ORIENTATION=-
MALGGMGEAPLTTIHMEDVSLTVVPGGKKFRRVAPIVHGGGASATIPLEFDVKLDEITLYAEMNEICRFDIL